MRTEQEMMNLILSVAEKDERVRAVAMNGSRTNQNVQKDIFQDYDIVYLVTELNSFLCDPNWIDVFGERLILQMPESKALIPPDHNGRFPYLMQFTDGNRIDLTLIPLSDKETYCREDKLTIILMDKDKSLPDIPPPTDEEYWVKRPTEQFFEDCCNEFWWVSIYVAKGLWRSEYLYAQENLNLYVRPMLMKMLGWKVGIQTDFSVSVGKNGKYLEKYLEEEEWQSLLSTYEGGSYEKVWRALFAMCRLFRQTSQFVSEQLDFPYPYGEDQRVSAFLEHIEKLPVDAVEIY